MAAHNLAERLGPRPTTGSIGGRPLVKIRGLLPDRVAEGALAAIQAMPPDMWELSEAATDTSGNKAYGAGSTQHRLSATSGDPAEGEGHEKGSRAQLAAEVCRPLSVCCCVCVLLRAPPVSACNSLMPMCCVPCHLCVVCCALSLLSSSLLRCSCDSLVLSVDALAHNDTSDHCSC
jgi:hypothetical protein